MASNTMLQKIKKIEKLPLYLAGGFNFPDITETSNDGQQLLPKNSQPFFSDLAKSLAGDGFSLVQRKNKQQRTLTHEIKDVNEDVLGVEVHNLEDSHKLIVPKKFHKVVGNKTESVKLKAKKIPSFRLYIGNLFDCTSADEKKPDDNSELKDNFLANAFSICIDKQDLVKIRDPNIWPSDVIIRDWIFNKHPNQINDHTME
ncbi:hypothetical protein HELRODRAFT_158643 [Helobdella robusta]|uniref:Uncharacterized protein n=1 Tax=Helobdella robusta TaxID=6412 RepID=T1EN26_HELRO|nr:hypothetical protein HELRODRAFT_158643 [Helobdella robusta]ESO12179.1 hypothetical protein HELRODRAFT_158643 [Helobdella robusta]